LDRVHRRLHRGILTDAGVGALAKLDEPLNGSGDVVVDVD
jgi:hypothetical protein